jgi:hypothetical protein
MIRSFFLSTVIAAAIFGDAAGALAATPDDAKVSVTRFFEAIAQNNGPEYSQVAPQVYIMAAPDFGVPMSLDQARQALEGCRLRQIDNIKALDRVPGAFQVLVTLVCPTERHIAPTAGLLTDGQHILAVYPGGFPPPRPHP